MEYLSCSSYVIEDDHGSAHRSSIHFLWTFWFRIVIQVFMVEKILNNTERTLSCQVKMIIIVFRDGGL